MAGIITTQGLSRLKIRSRCIICSSNKLVVVERHMPDIVTGASNLFVDFRRCEECQHVQQGRELSQSEILNSYSAYYTRSPRLSETYGRGKFDKFKFFKSYYEFEYKGVKSIKGILFFLLSRILPFARYFLKRAVIFQDAPTDGQKLTFVDVGCGQGDLMMRMKLIGFDCLGVDFDSQAVNIARRRGLNVLLGDTSVISKDVACDVLALQHVIEHVPDPQKMLNDLYKVIKPGGVLYIVTPNYMSSGRKMFGKYWRGYDAPRHLNIFNDKNLEKMLTKSGFRCVQRVKDIPQSVGIMKSSIRLQRMHLNRSNSLFRPTVGVLISMFRVERQETLNYMCRK